MNRKRDKNMDIKEKINAFLYFSYLPPPITATSRYINLIEENTNPATKNNYATMSTQQLLKIGSDSFNSAIEERILNNKTNIVPLSGGLDSRAILAALIENGLKDEVITVTFGTPGTYDYEIGPYIAKIIGVKNEPIDLTSVRLEETDLISTASELENWTRVFEAHYNQLICKKYGKNVVYWSGVMAGPTTGSNLLAADSSLWEEAVQSFICRNRYAKKRRLIASDFLIEQLIPKKPFLDITALSFDEQLDFAIRQEHGIKPIVIPEGYNYLTPFLQHSWLKFTLNLSRYYRENQYFYKEMLQKTYPYLYSLNTKNNMGLPISAPGWRKDLIKNALLIKTLFFKFLPFYKNTTLSPNTNYIDFNKGLRDRNDLKSIVYGSLNDLKRRQIVDWLNLDDLWCQHQSNRANLADELISLASLEIFLKAEEIKKHL